MMQMDNANSNSDLIQHERHQSYPMIQRDVNHSFCYVSSNSNRYDALLHRGMVSSSTSVEGIRNIVNQLLETERNLEQKNDDGSLGDREKNNKNSNPFETVLKCESSTISEVEADSLSAIQCDLGSSDTLSPLQTDINFDQNVDLRLTQYPQLKFKQLISSSNENISPYCIQQIASPNSPNLMEGKVKDIVCEFNQCENNFGSSNSASPTVTIESTFDLTIDCSSASPSFSGISSDVQPDKVESSNENRCNLCLYSTKHKYLLDNHMRLHSGNKPFQCSHCQYSSVKKSNLVKHISIHSTEDFYQCNVCSFRTPTLDILNQHSSIHVNDNHLLKCKECPYSTTISKNFDKHILVHKEKLFKCDFCSYTCNANSKLKFHIKTHTSKKIFNCKSCSYSTADKNHFSKHLRVHSGVKTYQCKICSYCSFEKGNLDKHRKTHLGEKPFVCQLCSYCTSIKGNLTKHIRTHTGERSFICDLCSYSTYEKSNLTKHRRIHTGDKRFKCEICSYCTSEKGNLTKHKRTHSAKKSYHCKICPFDSLRKDQLMLHLEQHKIPTPKSVSNFQIVLEPECNVKAQ